jgi:hypothetical protein
MGILAEIQNDITGAQALADWLGGEPPVIPGAALFRAESCVQGNEGKPCPLNVEPNWWERNLKDPIARWITREIEEKHRLKLATPYDAQLHMCGACGCCMKLKVWTPPKVLRKHVTEKQVEKTPAFCWMRKLLL